MNKFHKQLSTEFLRQRHGLMAFIQGMVRDPHAAEDIFQEVWIRLAEASEKGTDIRDTLKWSRGVAKNLILHHWRDTKKQAGSVFEEILDLADTAFQEEDGIVEAWVDRKSALKECMKQLPSESRKLLTLKYSRGLSSEKAGERIRKSASAVMMMLSRIRQGLKNCIEKRLQTGEV